MGRKNAKEVVKYEFPTAEEIKTAQLACCGRCCNQCETPAAYAWRKREVDMAVLLEKAIREELTGVERQTITAHWFDSEPLSRIAERRGVSPASVTKTVTRAQDKLAKVLGYAVLYQQNSTEESVIPVVLGRARVIAAARCAVGGTAGDRLTRLRQSQNLTKRTLGEALGIDEARLSALEGSEDVPNAQELLSISEFFSVTADFILKGEKADDEKTQNYA